MNKCSKKCCAKNILVKCCILMSQYLIVLFQTLVMIKVVLIIGI